MQSVPASATRLTAKEALAPFLQCRRAARTAYPTKQRTCSNCGMAALALAGARSRRSYLDHGHGGASRVDRTFAVRSPIAAGNNGRAGYTGTCTRTTAAPAAPHNSFQRKGAKEAKAQSQAKTIVFHSHSV